MQTTRDRVSYIYGLADPISGLVRYIGKGLYPEYRYKNHLYFKTPKTHKQKWIAYLRKQGLLPALTIIETTNEKEACAREVFWIADYRARGFKLTNATDGGEGIPGLKRVFTSEHKRKIGDSRRGIKHTLESKARMSISQKGNKNSLGYIPTEEKRRKISEANTGHVPTEETRKKLSIAGFGREHSPETRAKLSEATRQYWARKKAM